LAEDAGKEETTHLKAATVHPNVTFYLSNIAPAIKYLTATLD